MSAGKYIAKIFQKEWKGAKDSDYDYKSLMQQRTIDYRKEGRTVVKLDRPTNLPSAKQVGYKAKEGIFVVRVRVRKGSGTHIRPRNKRRPKRQGKDKLTRRKSIRSIAEERASKKFENAEVLGSYKIAEDGQSHYYEIVLADRETPTIKNDAKLKFLSVGQRGRAERGKTFSGGKNKAENKKVHAKKKKKKAMQTHNHNK